GDGPRSQGAQIGSRWVVIGRYEDEWEGGGKLSERGLEPSQGPQSACGMLRYRHCPWGKWTFPLRETRSNPDVSKPRKPCQREDFGRSRSSPGLGRPHFRDHCPASSCTHAPGEALSR